ncbi:glycosyltransferase family 4 protein [Deinococcus sp. QL22]|uniref:glycosyltransferase family 4 protein n=1 Tax=Deinococcus sp. QL22 TaxID=2939437 RepID=UPI002017ADCB|nr:glycosyltransferase family 4 protein [Deinococcus sp. QL22]UQN09562.1 glycosyltransferase family 4 protein [Deinococcus sp. QL22]
MKPTLMYLLTIPQSALWYLRGQLAEMQRRGYETVFVSSVGDGGELAEVSRQEGVRTFPLEVSREIDPVRDLRSMWQLHQIMLKTRPDIVNFGNPKTGLVGGIVSALWRVPVRVYTLHGLRLETSVGVKRQLLVWTERLTMLCAHQVVAVSPSLRERSLALGLVSPERIITLHHGSVNGIREMRIEHAKVQALRLELGLPEEALVYGFVGRLTRDKGIRELVAAFHHLHQMYPQARLLLVGDFETGDPVDDTTRHQIETTDTIISAGYASDVVPYYGLIDVLVLPTYREGFPTVALEGAALGLPLITTDATGARDAVQEQVTGLRVAVGDVDDLARAMKRLAHDEPLRRRLGQQGKAWVQQDFAQERLWQEWDTLYQQLLAKAQAGRSSHPRSLNGLWWVALCTVFVFTLINLLIRRPSHGLRGYQRG